MATLQEHVNKQPVIYRKRYQSNWIGWANELLEELSGRRMMPTISLSRGAVVKNDSWIDKPAGMRQLLEVSNPANPLQKYRFHEENNRICLSDVTLDAEDSPTTPTAFTQWATDSFEIDVTGESEDAFENYLFVVTAGTYAGKTYVISGNDDSGDTTTKLYFLHELATALDGTKVTAGYITGPNYYLMLKYKASYEEIDALSDELPISDDYEKRVVKAWLRWKVEEHIDSASKETRYWEIKASQSLYSVQSERMSQTGGPPRGRRLVGFERSRGTRKSHPDYSEFS
jgi:hypothetical protein